MYQIGLDKSFPMLLPEMLSLACRERSSSTADDAFDRPRSQVVDCYSRTHRARGSQCLFLLQGFFSDLGAKYTFYAFKNPDSMVSRCGQTVVCEGLCVLRKFSRKCVSKSEDFPHHTAASHIESMLRLGGKKFQIISPHVVRVHFEEPQSRIPGSIPR